MSSRIRAHIRSNVVRYIPNGVFVKTYETQEL